MTDPHRKGWRPALLVSPAFLLCLGLLLVNDLVLKSLLHNWITGKLSDFAGLFVFAIFWTALVPRHRTVIHLITAIGFVLFKSPQAQPLIDGFNALGLMTIGRVVDWSDLLALAILPVGWWWTGRTARTTRRKAPAMAVGALAMFAFVATSKTAPEEEDGSTDAEADVVDDEDAVDENVALFGYCPTPAEIEEEATEISFAGVLNERWLYCNAATTPVEGIIGDEVSWQAFLADVNTCIGDPTGPITIDFSRAYVIVGGYASTRTCGLTFDKGRVYWLEATGQPHVELEFTDIAGTSDCPSCTDSEGTLVAVVVEHAMGTNPTMCRRITNGCQ